MALLRVAIGGILLWFGALAVLDPAGQFFWLAPWIQSLPLMGYWFVLLFGLSQVLVGLALIVGLYPRWAALVAATMLAGIIINLGFQEIAMRDFVILCASLVVASASEHRFSLRP